MQNDEGQWVTDQEELLELSKNYYSDLFTSDPICGGMFLKGHFPSLFSNQLEFLAEDFRDEEISTALKEIGPFKEPGPDGFNARFYQKT